MKTKREVLKHIVKYGNCAGILCAKDCPYYMHSYICPYLNLKKIGAMAILRMFPKKKKPILEVGTKIKFDNGEIATVFRDEVNTRYVLDFVTRFELMEYLIGKTWEVVEE